MKTLLISTILLGLLMTSAPLELHAQAPELDLSEEGFLRAGYLGYYKGDLEDIQTCRQDDRPRMEKLWIQFAMKGGLVHGILRQADVESGLSSFEKKANTVDGTVLYSLELKAGSFKPMEGEREDIAKLEHYSWFLELTFSETTGRLQAFGINLSLRRERDAANPSGAPFQGPPRSTP